MDSVVKFIKIIDALKDRGKTLQEISEITGFEIGEIRDIIIDDLKKDLSISKFWEIEIYKDDNNLLSDYVNDNYESILRDPDGDVLSKEDYKKILTSDIILETYCDFFNIDNINDFTTVERWTIYNLIKECRCSFIEDEAEQIISAYNDEFSEKYENISKRRVIKGNYNIFNIDKKMVLEIYDAVDKRYCLNIMSKDGNNIQNVSPICIFFDSDIQRWYVEYSRKGKSYVIRFDKIDKIARTNHKYMVNQEIGHYFGHDKNKELVKIRVYDENNGKEKTIRYLARKNIESIYYGDGFIDVEIWVSDVNLFKRWLREMGPQCVVLEPEELRNEFLSSIDKWKKKYDI